MSKESKNVSAAAKAVEKSQQKGKVERTPEQRLLDIRKNLAQGLAVTAEDQKWVLSLYDESRANEDRNNEIIKVLETTCANATIFIDDLTARLCPPVQESGSCGTLTEA